MTKIRTLACLLAVILACPAVAQSVQPDPRIKELLGKARLEYQYDENAGFKLINRFASGRLQAIFIDSRTQTVGDLEVRRIWSIAHMGDSLDAALLRRLMVDNQNLKLGRWSIAQVNGKESAIFSTTLEADARLGALLSHLSIVAGSADELERSLSDKDTY
jgi:hypothetical protein